MTQKWNLQDIRPTAQSPKNRPSVSVNRPKGDTLQTAPEQSARPINDMRPNRPWRTTEPTAHSSFAEPSDSEYEDDNRIPIVDGKRRGQKHIFIAVAVFLTITVLGFVVGNLTGGATITVYPKTRSLNVNAEFTAFKEQKAGELAYEILTLKAESERQVEASGQEDVKVQATGEIEITKTTPGAERLIKNTRFATSDGLVFRIEESVVVPGAVTDSAGKSTPGTIRAKVFADQPGDSYNLTAGTELSVPGFKEGNYLDLYNAIKAKNPTAFTNGFAGPKFIIDEAALGTARQSLQAELRDTLLARVQNERPAHVTTFTDAVAITYSQLPTVQYGDKLVTIREEAVLQLPIFKTEDFARYIAKETIVGYDDEPVRINNLDSLKFTYSSATTSQINIADLESLTFKLIGTPLIVWSFDEGKLKLDLLNKEKTAIPQIMTAYKGFDRTEVKVRPVWKTSLPGSIDDITIIEKLP